MTAPDRSDALPAGDVLCFATSAPLLAACRALRVDATGAPPVVAAFRLDAVGAALSRSRRCAIVWQGPQAALANALDSGESPRAAMARWQQMAQEVLELHRRNRRNLTLVAEAALTGPDQGCLDLLRDRLGWIWKENSRPTDADNGLATLLADLVIRQLPDLAGLLDPLWASSISPPAAGDDTVWLERAALAVLAQNELAGAAQTYGEQSAGLPERAALLERLTGVEAASTALQSQLVTQAADLTAAREDAVHARAESARHQADLQAARKEIDLLRQQLALERQALAESAALQSQLVTQAADLQAARQQAESLTSAGALDREEIDLLRQQLVLEKQALAEWIKPLETVERLRTEGTALRAQLAEAQGLQRSTRQDLEAARTDATAAKTGLLAAEGEIARLTRAQAIAAADVLLLNEQLALQMAELERALALDARLAEADRQRLLQLAAVAQADQTISALQAENEALGAAGATAAQSLAASQSEGEALKAEIDTLRRFKDEAELLADALISTQGHLGAQSAEAEALRQKATALLNSTSWRVTAPLRGVGTLLGRRRS